MRYSRLALFPPSTRSTLKLFGDVFAKSCYSEMGRSVLLLLTSKSFDSLETCTLYHLASKKEEAQFLNTIEERLLLGDV